MSRSVERKHNIQAAFVVIGQVGEDGVLDDHGDSDIASQQD